MKKKSLRFVQIAVDPFANLYGLTTDGRIFHHRANRYLEELQVITREQYIAQQANKKR